MVLLCAAFNHIVNPLSGFKLMNLQDAFQIVVNIDIEDGRKETLTTLFNFLTLFITYQKVYWLKYDRPKINPHLSENYFEHNIDFMYISTFLAELSQYVDKQLRSNRLGPGISQQLFWVSKFSIE